MGTDERPIAVVWNYAIHGTMLGASNFKLSGDVMGDASARIEEQLGAPALYVNGAVGDVSPRQRGWDGVAATGKLLSAAVLALWPRIAAGRRSARDHRGGETAALPAPALELRNCLGRWIPRGTRLGLRSALPATAEIAAVGVGRAAWVTIPGELDTQLGLEIKAAGRARFARTFVAGVANGYQGYFLAAQHFRPPSYISCGSLYGERGGEIVRDAALGALRGARRAARAAAGQAGALSLRASADLRRAAVLRWITPWVTARSIARMASCTAVADSPVLSARASRAPLTLERTALRTARLRCRRFSFCLIRFLAERVLATVYLLSRRERHTSLPSGPPGVKDVCPRR